jgi:hypothetical protein
MARDMNEVLKTLLSQNTSAIRNGNPTCPEKKSAPLKSKNLLKKLNGSIMTCDGYGAI